LFEAIESVVLLAQTEGSHLSKRKPVISPVITQADLANATTRLEKIILESTIELKSDCRIFKWCFGIMLPAIITILLPVLNSAYQQLLGQ
jgi:hypothetical protein